MQDKNTSQGEFKVILAKKLACPSQNSRKDRQIPLWGQGL